MVATAVPIRIAMVLAAGLGTRMRPLTLERPKPLLPVAGRSLLDHVLDAMAAADVETAVVNTHYLGGMVEAHVAGRQRPAIHLSPEAELLETGGGVRNALPLLGPGPFFVANADNVWQNGPIPVLQRLTRAWDADAMDALLLLVPKPAAIGYDGRGDYLPSGPAAVSDAFPLRFRGADATAAHVFAGVKITTAALYRQAPDGPFSNKLLWDAAERAGRLFGLIHDGAWFHVGTPQALEDVNRRLAAPF